MVALQFLSRTQRSQDVWEYFFQPTEPIRYLAGQYAEFSIADLIDPRGKTRIFTLTSLPDTPVVSFAVKISDTPSPYKHRLSQLQPGEILYIGQPTGDMILPRHTAAPLIFVAGGLGIASFIPLLKECNRSELAHSIRLLWALRRNEDRFELPAVRSANGIGYQEFIAPNRLSVGDIVTGASTNELIYISGSEQFVMKLRHDLHAIGINDARILFDYFSGYDEL